MNERRQFVQWIRRARPPWQALTSALASGVTASFANVTLLIGAVSLLVESARRPGLQAVLGVLIVIEVLAFLRSPLRFAERMTAHRLGYEAVSHWRSWLVTSVSSLPYRRWREYASGDLLERSLRDTDELQDLWLRVLLPFSTSVIALAGIDLVVVLLTPRWRWWLIGGLFVVIQSAAVALQIATTPALIRADRDLRNARAHYRSTLIELGSVAPELGLLNGDDVVRRRSHQSEEALDRAERHLHRRQRRSGLIAPLATVLSAIATALRPSGTSQWSVVTAMIALATFDVLQVTRSAVETAVSVVGGTQRLDDLSVPTSASIEAWPNDVTVQLSQVAIVEADDLLIDDATLSIAPGARVAITGPSGSGKSTLLRVMVGLDQPETGDVAIGSRPLATIDHDALRQHVAYVPSEPGLLRGYAVDVISLGRPASRDFIQDLHQLHLDVTRDTYWENLSRGEEERVALVRALLVGPSIIVLDEPTSGLGASDTSAVLELLAASRATVVVATHDRDVMAWCDRVFEINDGALVELSR